MNRLDNMLERLPPIYRIERGSLLHQVFELVSLELATFDEDLDRVQRSHWIDHAFDRADLEKIGALCEISPGSWEPDRLYRARLKATIAARLAGSVTRKDLERVLTEILVGAQDVMGLRMFALRPGASALFATGESERPDEPRFVEFPLARRRSQQLIERGGRLKPLERFTAENRGMGATALELVLRGVAGKRTAVPVIINLTNGCVLGFAGLVRAGAELRVELGANGALHATLDGRDVTSRLYSSDRFVTGARFEPVIPDPSPRPIRLERGVNDLWFLSLALYDQPGLDQAMLAMASPDLVQGVFADARAESVSDFDFAVFHQPIAAVLDCWWDEREPASFRFDVPAGAVRRDADDPDAPELERDHLFGLLQDTVDLLRAAAVRGEVRPRALADVQPAEDRGFVWSPHLEPEQTSSGEDALASLGALFDLSGLDQSHIE